MSTTRSCLGTARLASAMNHIFAAYGFVLQLSPRFHDVTSLPFPYISHGEDAAAPLLEVHPDPLPEPSTMPPHKTQRPEQFLLLASTLFNFCPHCRLLASPEEAQQGKGRRTEGLGTVRPPASQPFPAPTDDNRRLGSRKQPRSATLRHAEPQRSHKRLSVKPYSLSASVWIHEIAAKPCMDACATAQACTKENPLQEPARHGAGRGHLHLCHHSHSPAGDSDIPVGSFPTSVSEWSRVCITRYLAFDHV